MEVHIFLKDICERNSATGVRTHLLRFRSLVLEPLHHEDTLPLLKNSDSTI